MLNEVVIDRGMKPQLCNLQVSGRVGGWVRGWARLAAAGSSLVVHSTTQT